ncbi:MAG: hypothetical protein E7530_07405 [Ruminococcaceae bacterium]|nr:hypothetical protein [Oscillospiraceae bacterium]
MANEPQKEPQKKKKSFAEYIIAAVAFILVAVLYFVTCGDSGSSSGKKWSDLSDREKDNARWAYHAQQAIDNYER